MSSAYVIAETKVEDPSRYTDYGRLAAPSIEKFGGVYVVRGGAIQSLLGEWQPERLAVVRFDSIERAKQWWNSPDYREAKLLRTQIATSKILLVEGA
ncbi:MAG: hypothetical protein JWN04_5585 [Myxococcaceae bacterium]|nr:hypothetical protein [Myxococcaceae bacterium]